MSPIPVSKDEDSERAPKTYIRGRSSRDSVDRLSTRSMPILARQYQINAIPQQQSFRVGRPNHPAHRQHVHRPTYQPPTAPTQPIKTKKGSNLNNTTGNRASHVLGLNPHASPSPSRSVSPPCITVDDDNTDTIFMPDENTSSGLENLTFFGKSAAGLQPPPSHPPQLVEISTAAATNFQTNETETEQQETATAMKDELEAQKNTIEELKLQVERYSTAEGSYKEEKERVNQFVKKLAEAVNIKIPDDEEVTSENNLNRISKYVTGLLENEGRTIVMRFDNPKIVTERGSCAPRASTSTGATTAGAMPPPQSGSNVGTSESSNSCPDIAEFLRQTGNSQPMLPFISKPVQLECKVTQMKNYKCQHCGKTYVLLKRLRHHLEKVHSVMEAPEVVCTFCLERLKDGNELSMHYINSCPSIRNPQRRAE